MKKLWMLSVLVLALSTGCAYKDPLFQPYVDMVIKSCDKYNCGKQQRINEISVSFGETDENKIGQCGPNGIIFNKKLWDNVTEGSHEILIYHEMGHCAFDLEDYYDNDDRLKIMFYSTNNLERLDKWNKDKEPIIEEFFNEIK